MLSKIWKILKAIGAFFSAVAGFIQDTISAIIEFFSMIPKAISYLLDCIAWLPVSVLAIVGVIITVLFVKKVVNR